MNMLNIEAAMRDVKRLIGRTVKIDFVEAKITGAQIQTFEGNPEVVFLAKGGFCEFSPGSSSQFNCGWYRKEKGQERQCVWLQWEILDV